ncbi:PilW family protein [Noviherbaspirillum sp. ST9]|uniref:PilW family protein n=1 Tax=Noviherbaspirillum sp. ST9 TaxID=3401606 RepID=UPI003B588483
MHHRQNGFSLVEVIVGLGIGLISMLVVMQAFAVFEGEKRTTTSGVDAQNNGAISLYMIEQDARMAGWGMDATVYTGCDTTYSYCDGSAECGGAVGALPGLDFASLKAVDGGTRPDTFAAQYFADVKVASFSLPTNTTLQKTMPRPSAELDVGSVNGCNEGEFVLVQQAGSCTLMQITHIQDTALKIQHNPGSSGPYNPPEAYQKENGWPAYTRGARLSCFAKPNAGALFQRSYSIDTKTWHLQRTDSGNKEVIASDIMDLQLQYGITAGGGSQVVNDWVDAAGETWGNPSSDDAKRIKAVRIALVARSTQYEKPKDGVCKTTTPEMVEKWSDWAAFKTGHYPDDWQCYRYKVFETVVPLRNVLWAKL